MLLTFSLLVSSQRIVFPFMKATYAYPFCSQVLRPFSIVRPVTTLRGVVGEVVWYPKSDFEIVTRVNLDV